MGGGKGGGTSTTNNISKTEIPPEVLARYNAVNARAEAVAQQPYQRYSNDPNAFVAGLTPTQMAGIQNVNAMAGAAQPYYGAATNQLMQAQQGAQPGINAAYTNVANAQDVGRGYLDAATMANLAGGMPVTPGALQIGQYLNPFTQNVVEATQAAMNQQQGQQLAQQQAEAIRSGAFGGERAGLQRGQLRGQQSLAQAQAIAPLYQQGYQQALQTAQQQQGVGLGAAQANRQALQQMGQQFANLGQQGFGQGLSAAQQQAALAQQGYGMGANTATLLGNLGTGAQQAGLAGAQAQMQAGQAQQQTEQAAKQAMYNQFMQEQGYPFQVAQFLANVATGTGALSGNTTAGSGTTTTTGGGGFFSDERLKENIQKVGKTNDGQPIYRYNYKGDPRTQIGLLAQDVEKDHPEAVGLAGGYKTVDYKKATQDAVHKADGGGMTGDAYSMDAPSQMLNKPPGLGALALPQMVTGAGIPVRSMTPASEIEALRAPKVMGLSPGTLEAARAQRATLGSALEGGDEDKLKMGAGRGYIQSEYDRLGRFLEPYGGQYSSAGGLVGPEGGAFARGGLAFGGVPDYAKGIYGVEITPMQQRGILQGTPMVMPQQQQRQTNPIDEATKVAGLVSGGYKLYKDRPDFLRSAEDVAKRKDEDIYRQKIREEYLQKHGIEPTKVAETSSEDFFKMPEYAAHGGLIGNRHGYYGDGYVNPQGYVSGVLQEQSSAPPPRKLAHSAEDFKPPKPPEQKGGGLDDLMKLAGTGEKLYKGGQWAAGKLGLGAPETAMSATSTGMVPEVIDLTSGAGLAAGVPEAAAIAPETVAALAPEAGLLSGVTEFAAPIMTAAADFAAPLLFFLKDGGAVPHRKNYQNRGLVVPDEYSTAEPALVGAEGGNETTTQGGDSGETKIPRASLAPPLARPAARVPTPEDAIAPVPVPREPRPGVASASRPSFPDVGGLVPEGMRDTLSSENFWVPALAGIGSMLASPNKTLLGAVGSGLVGGTTAYTDLQKQNALQTKQRFELAKDLFKGPVEGDDKKLYWRHVPSGKLVPQEEYERLYSDFVRGNAGTPRITAPSSETPAVATARGVIAEQPPQLTKVPTSPPAPAATTVAETPAPDTAQAQAQTAQTPAAPPPAEGQPPLKNKTQIKNEMLASPQTWADAPRERNPILLRQEAARLEGEVRQLRDKARRIATTMPENTTEGPRLTAEANQLDANRKEMIERSEKILDDAAELAYEDQKTQSAGRTAQTVGRTAVPTTPDVPLPKGMTVAQAENDPDYLGSRIESNMKKYNELKERGALKEANDYYAKVEKDRAQLEKVIGTEYTTPEGTKYSVHPNAEVFNVTQPKPIPKDYKANVDPNTGIVVSKPIGEFIGYPETGGHPVSPALIGKKAVIKGEGDKRLIASKAQSDELEKAFIGGAEKAEDGIATIIKFSTAAKVLESKGMNIPYAELANIARGLGFESIANQLMSDKNTAAAFTALKTNVDQAINQVTNNFTRPTQAEFLITEKKATPSIDMPVDAARSLTQTRLAGLMWQNAILSDWENAKRETGATNFAAFRDVWQKTHPKALFEDAADRVLGNFKGQALPKPEKFAEGVVYVVPKNVGETQVGRELVAKGLRPGDLFVMNGVNHEAKDIGEPMRVSPADAYKAHLRAPALTYGAR